ncbi:hypothetical protein NF701_02500 [Sphingomonadaceae bacterium OTU29THOMA1]|nr:hypothetical protein NF701_02500 [Sphingomonadaceae bacterium OTU29THOMA1]
MDRDAALRALAISVAELTRTFIDFDAQSSRDKFEFDGGRKFVISRQLDVLSDALAMDDLSMLAAELRDEIEP